MWKWCGRNNLGAGAEGTTMTSNERHADRAAIDEGRMCYTTIAAWMPGVDWLSVQPITAEGADECEESRG
jgi:hypothetical protein